MIHFLVTRRHRYTIEEYLKDCAPDLQPVVQLLYYEDLPLRRRLARGVYIFADLERLNSDYMELARRACDALLAAGDCVVLNNPAHVRRREELLRELHRAGLNPFAVHRVTDDLHAVRFPAFIRRLSEHEGALIEPLDSFEALAAALAKIRGGAIPDDDLLIVEYCETVDARKIYRRFGAFNVAGRIIPRSVLHSQKWVVKYQDYVDPDTIEEEKKYLASNPHQAAVEKIFNLARIDYGRIDYNLLGDRIVTWEINTNPSIRGSPVRLSPLRAPLFPLFREPFTAALRSLDQPASARPIHFAPSASLKRRLKCRLRDRIARAVSHRLGRLFARGKSGANDPGVNPGDR